MFRIGILLIIFVTAALSLIYGVLDPMAGRCDRAADLNKDIVCPRYVDFAVSYLLIISAIIALFGTMAIAGAQHSDGTFREQRIRLSVAFAILVVYLIYFGMAIMWGGQKEGSQKLLETFTNLMMVVIPFYFASSAAVEWSARKDKNHDAQRETATG
jgi:hypothetical protein